MLEANIIRKNDIKFSIVIPVFNAEKFILKALDSVLQQTYQEFELILINDGSTDDSLSILKTYAASHSNVPIKIVNQNNSGAGIARNKGINLASGDYLIFLDSDDYLEVDFLENVLQTIYSNNSDLVFVDIIRETECGTLIRRESMSSFATLSADKMIRAQLTGKMPWGGVRKVARLKMIKDYRICFADLKVGEECIYSFELLRHSKIISFQKNAKYHYVANSKSLTSQDSVENSLLAYNYVSLYFLENKLDKVYERTLRSKAVTTMVVAINNLAQTHSFTSAYQMSRQLLAEYKKHFVGRIDLFSLEKRVLLCAPFVKARMPLGIILASKLRIMLRK